MNKINKTKLSKELIESIPSEEQDMLLPPNSKCTRASYEEIPCPTDDIPSELVDLTADQLMQEFGSDYDPQIGNVENISNVENEPKQLSQLHPSVENRGENLHLYTATILKGMESVGYTLSADANELPHEIGKGFHKVKIKDDEVCRIPPYGWECTRKQGHEGPCAAIETKVGEAELRAIILRVCSLISDAEYQIQQPSMSGSGIKRAKDDLTSAKKLAIIIKNNI